jgi:hypothetical protein
MNFQPKHTDDETTVDKELENLKKKLLQVIPIYIYLLYSPRNQERDAREELRRLNKSLAAEGSKLEQIREKLAIVNKLEVQHKSKYSLLIEFGSVISSYSNSICADVSSGRRVGEGNRRSYCPG